ncbi:lipoprotein [Planotetraspora thailandica]|uniref:Lipoprotein n=1 Tax=Planotetraspora thailandica TaxID=487172 RepID=A0A8J3XU68_9ACTN|nr:SurA N-terminal domain-containing protein [Planotetraspora thailandica]GII52924.1 lipoprotein [Planotetraspora thailandica]
MKSYVLRAVVAAAVAGVALSGCGGPVQAGAAALVGDERISASDLNATIDAFRKDLAANKMTEQQLQLSLPLPQMILLNMANNKQFEELAQQKGITVPQGEVDAWIAQQGGQEQIDKALLASGIPLSNGGDAVRAVIIRTDLMQQYGAGADEQSQQAALAKVTQEADAKVPLRFSPRYGKFDPQQGFLPDTRFGAVAKPAPVAPAPDAGAPDATAPDAG